MVTQHFLHVADAWKLLNMIYITPKYDTYKAVGGWILEYRSANKSLARPGRKQATVTEDFDVHISYLLP